MPKRSRVSIDRCVPGSKRRIDSTVSPMNSIRIGSSSPAGEHVEDAAAARELAVRINRIHAGS